MAIAHSYSSFSGFNLKDNRVHTGHKKEEEELEGNKHQLGVSNIDDEPSPS